MNEGLMPSPPWLAAYPAKVRWDQEFPPMRLDALFDAAAARFPDRPALDFLGRKFSYREVADLVARAAAGLQQADVGKGSRVGLFLPNCPYFPVLFYAALKAGATVVSVNPLYAEPEVRALIADAGIEIMATLDLEALYRPLSRMLEETPLRRIVVCSMADALPFPKRELFRLLKRKTLAAWPKDPRHLDFADLVANDGRPRDVAIDPVRDVAVLQYTGGTTGTPKAAMLTHQNLAANTRQCLAWFCDTEPGAERVLAVLPFFHVFAMTTAMNYGFAAGAEIVMLPRFELKTLLKAIQATRPTIFAGVPTIFTAINNAAAVKRYDLSSIKCCISGGAPLPVEVKAAFEKLTGCVLVEGYGLSEASPVAVCNPFGGENRAGSIGLPLPGTTVEIVSLDDGDSVLPVGERGEICIRGPQVMAGYWNRPEETAQALRGGRLHTGDVGYVDTAGYVYLVDRVKDLILCSGYNVYPRNIEEAVYRHPEVAECCAIGVPDPYRGETVKLFVVRRPGATLTEKTLCDFLKGELSPIELPKLVEFRDALPKTAIGKISRKLLAAEETSQRAAE
jgi:long-chain acyl-CoA synthetase